MKLLFRTSDYSDFLIRRSVLESAGLHVHADNFESYSAMPELGMSDGYRLWVLDDDYDQGLRLLDESAGESDLPGEFIETDIDRIDSCPKCGSSDVIRYRKFSFELILWFIGMLVPGSGGGVRACRACEYKYEAEGAVLVRSYRVMVLLVMLLVAGLVWLA